MNRQIRRAQEKQDKKQQKEKEKKRAEVRARMARARATRRDRAESRLKANDPSRPPTEAERKRMPGRFSGVLTIVTVFFISLQNAAPATENGRTVGASLIGAGFYLMLGYFATLWFMRRGVPRAPLMSGLGGAILAASGAVISLLQGRELDPLMLLLAVPAVLVGAFLGRLVFIATPR